MNEEQLYQLWSYYYDAYDSIGDKPLSYVEWCKRLEDLVSRG